MARSDRIRTDLHVLIRNLDERCRTSIAAAPDPSKPPTQWTAVLFLVRTQHFLTPLEQVSEVLEMPRDITRVPGTKPWLVGVANNRGVLLPIFHLATFMEQTQQQPSPPHTEFNHERRREGRSRERVLVIRQDELPCGLIVSEAIGMRSIQFNTRTTVVPDGFGACQPYIDASFLFDGAPVPVIRLARLITDPLFQAANG
ncbi:chemotaxis protein CheW [Chromatium okenii]|uniref:chemotaxis protein CheW n=1 Tax=Chromatium okenii TaxID=61644 RepID=UPI0026EA78F7|nr:chemotaxis protein CheW [Chromatium okenii]MBV5307861.1 chemotaxis protein CheW [Chromatium okenii]